MKAKPSAMVAAKFSLLLQLNGLPLSASDVQKYIWRSSLFHSLQIISWIIELFE